MSGLIHLQGGHVIDPVNGLDDQRDLWLDRGRIAAVGAAPGSFQADRRIDADGLIALPGLVDLAATVPDAGSRSLGDELTAAAAGGVTTLACAPAGGGMLDEPGRVRALIDAAEALGRARVVPLGALSLSMAGEHLAPMAALLEAGCPALGHTDAGVTDSGLMRRALEYAASLDVTVILRSDDPWLSAGGCAHEGPVAARLGLPAIPSAAELAGLGRDLALVRETGVKAHFHQLSTAGAVDLVRRARAEGLAVTADVAAHQLFLTENDLLGFDPSCRLIPPPRAPSDRDALREGVADGTIGVICSGHSPCTAEEKRQPFPASRPGIGGLESLLALGLRLVDEGVLDLSSLIQRLSTTPAQILNLPAASGLTPDAPADLCLLDPKAIWRLDPSNFYSRGRHSPFTGWELRGQIRQTFVAGIRAFDAAE